MRTGEKVRKVAAGREGKGVGDGVKEVRAVCVCVCVHLHVCLSQLCHSSEQQRLFRFMRAAPH